MQVNRPFFQPFMPHNMFNFKKATCILYHLAFLDWLPTHYYLHPKTHFQTPKTHLLTTISPLLAQSTMVFKGFIYSITAYFYAFRLAFNTISHCILHHFTLRLAPKCTAFSTKTHCVQHQNALRLAAYYTVFSIKQPKIWRKSQLFVINIHFVSIHSLPLFAS